MNRFLFVVFAGLAVLSCLVVLASILFSTYGGLIFVGGLFPPLASSIAFSLLAFKFSPWAETSAKRFASKFGNYESLSPTAKAELVAEEAARRLGISKNEYSSQLTGELRLPPREVMSLLDELAVEFNLPLSENDYPEVNSINAIANVVQRHSSVQLEA